MYAQQRYYDPIIGRFLSIDPVAADPNSGSNFNRYWYANNNPYKFTDPDGRIVETAFDVFSIGVGVASFVSNVSEGNFGAAALDAVGVVVDTAAAATPFVPGGVGVGLKVAREGAEAAGKVSQRAATREAKRQAGIPTSQQAKSQTSGRASDGTKVGRQQTLEVPKAGGGTETKSVQVSRDTRGEHAGIPQIVAGTVKPGGQVDQAGRPRIQNEGKVRVDFDPR